MSVVMFKVKMTFVVKLNNWIIEAELCYFHRQKSAAFNTMLIASDLLMFLLS